MNRFVFVFLALFVHNATSSSKLNVPRVLLPISNKTPVNFTLEVTDGGCYTWSVFLSELFSYLLIFSFLANLLSWEDDDTFNITALYTNINKHYFHFLFRLS